MTAQYLQQQQLGSINDENATIPVYIGLHFAWNGTGGVESLPPIDGLQATPDGRAEVQFPVYSRFRCNYFPATAISSSRPYFKKVAKEWLCGLIYPRRMAGKLLEFQRDAAAIKSSDRAIERAKQLHLQSRKKLLDSLTIKSMDTLRWNQSWGGM